MKFNEKLLFLRKENKLSQEQLADMLDVSRQSVSKWESGQTYPEMDKLLGLCKIFKCNLDELTNDEIKNISVKPKNNIFSFIDEILEIVNKSLNMFKRMSPKQAGLFVIKLLVLILIILLLRIPFDYLYYLPSKILYGFNNNVIDVLNNIWYMIMDIAYFIFAVVTFTYIYKVGFLDKFDIGSYSNNNSNMVIKDDIVVDEIIEDNNVDVKSEKVEKIRYKKENGLKIFSVFNYILVFLAKLIVFGFQMPFLGLLIFLFFALIICVGILFKGVLYIGVILTIIMAIILTIVIIEVMFNFLFNRKNDVRRIFILLVISLCGFGIGFGISFFEIASITYSDEVPVSARKEVKTEVYDMTKDLVVDYYSTNYVEDDSLENTIKVVVEYYPGYVELDFRLNNSILIFNYNYPRTTIINREIFDFMIKDLSNKKFYNYSSLYHANVTVYSTKENISILQDRYSKFKEENYENSIQETINTYQQMVSDLESKIYLFEQQNEDFEIEKENMKIEYETMIEEYKAKIEYYKSALKELIDN